MMKLTPMELEIIEGVHKLLSTEFSEPISPTIIARRYGMERRRLMSLFKYRYGQTMYQFYLRNSMDYARDRLEKGALVKEVASELGYATAGSFHRAFIRVHHVPPKRLKDQNAYGDWSDPTS